MRQRREDVLQRIRTNRFIQLIIPAVSALLIAATVWLLYDATEPKVEASIEPKACETARLTAHRGIVNKKHTENSLRALDLAARKGADAIEFDIRVTKDGHWMLMHDKRVDRTTNGKGLIANMTARKIRTLKLKDSTTKQVNRIPFLVDILALHKRYPSLAYQVEFKPQSVSRADLQHAVNLITRRVPSSQLVISSSDANLLTRIRAMHSTVRLAKITAKTVPVAEAAAQGFNAVNIHYQTYTAAEIEYLHSQGLEVGMRGAESPESWQEAVEKGADNLAVDRVVGYMNWCAGS